VIAQIARERITNIAMIVDNENMRLRLGHEGS
jgi:hypothetical protein